MAIAAAALAQKVADEAARQGAWPRYATIELARRNPHLQAALEPFGREDVAFTLDFIETADGLLLLEALVHEDGEVA